MIINKIKWVLTGFLLSSHIFAANVATVNGVEVTQTDVDDLIRLSEASGQPALNQAQAVDTLIQTEVMLQNAKKLKIDERPIVKKQLADFSKQLLISNMVEEIASEIVIPDMEYEAAYTDMKKTLDGKEYNAKHILLKEEKAGQEVINKLDAGEDFTKLAAEHSVGPTASTGGELNWFNLNAMDPDFSKGVAKLEKNQYTKAPVKSQFGFHVIFLNDVREVAPPSLEEVKPQLKSVLLSSKLIEQVNKLVAKATVERTPTDKAEEKADKK